MPNESDPQSSQRQEADWDAIARFIGGESDQAESRAVESWLASHPDDAELVRVVQRRAAHTEARAAVTVDVEGALASVQARLLADGTPQRAHAVASAAPETPSLVLSDGGMAREVPARRPARERAAAGARPRIRRWSVAVLASAAALALVVSRKGGMRDEAPSQVLATVVGTRDSLTLTDGSRVILAPGSRLTVAAGYGKSGRDVTLEGAAFFDVRHDDALPFTVRTGGAQIRDLGTAFSVKTDAEGDVSVAVTHGVVALSASASQGSAPVELRAGDRGTLRGERVAVARGTVTDDDVAWTRGHLAYRDASMSEVQADLRRWYGIELQLDGNDLKRRTLTASFPSDSVAKVINLIALALGADAIQHGDTVVLQRAGRSTTP